MELVFLLKRNPGKPQLEGIADLRGLHLAEGLITLFQTCSSLRKEYRV
jgi:hypothetical protein